MDPRKIAQFCKFYNSEMHSYGNEIYQHVETRIAHWINFQEGGWFHRRLDYYLESFQSWDLVIDLGFSVPYPYLRPKLSASETRFLFVDRELSSHHFYQVLVGENSLDSRKDLDLVLMADIESQEDHGRIIQAAQGYRPDSVMCVASEVIEHLVRSEIAWDLVRALASQLQVEKFLLYVTLPIGKKIPSHELVFENLAAARSYLSSHMTIEWERVLTPSNEAEAIPGFEACFCAAGRVK